MYDEFAKEQGMKGKGRTTQTTLCTAKSKYRLFFVSLPCSDDLPSHLPATPHPSRMSNPNLANIHTIRSNADALALAAALEATKAKNGRVVIVGGGYLGLEVSAAVSGWGIPTTVVFPDERLMARVFDAKIGAVYAGFYESKGIELLSGVTVVGFKAAEDGRTVAGVELADGEGICFEMLFYFFFCFSFSFSFFCLFLFIYLAPFLVFGVHSHCTVLYFNHTSFVSTNEQAASSPRTWLWSASAPAPWWTCTTAPWPRS